MCGGPSGSETTALISAFHTDFETWAIKMELSIYAELSALRQQMTVSETAVSAIAHTQ